MTDAAGDLIGIAPLLRRTYRYGGVLPFERLELLCTGESEADEICSPYVGIVAAQDREDDVADTLADLLKRGRLGIWDELVMSALPDGDPMLEPLSQALQRRRMTPELTETARSALIELPNSWDAYLKSLSSSHRYFVRRTVRDLEKWAGTGGYELKVASGAEALERAKEVLYPLHAERWSEESHPGVFASDRFRRFHEKLMSRLPNEEDGIAEVLWLSVGGDAVAAQYHFIYNERLYFYQSGRKTALPKGARPGIALHILAIQRAIEQGITAYDFLEGARQYKSQLASATRAQHTFRVVAPTLKSTGLERARRTLKTARDAAREAVVRGREAVDKHKELRKNDSDGQSDKKPT